MRCSSTPLEIVRGAIGLAAVAAFVVVVGGLFTLLLASDVGSAVLYLATNVIWWIDGAGSPPP